MMPHRCWLARWKIKKLIVIESQATNDSVIEKGIVSYSNATWLRTTVVGVAGAIGIVFPAIPAVVGAVDVAITTKAQKIAERRLNELCQSWENEMKQIPVGLIDRNYVESEEFFDLIFKAWEAAKRTRHDEKIHLYAKVLTQSVPLQDRSEHSPEDYLSILSELSLNELKVARALYHQQKESALSDESVFQWLNRIDAIETGKMVFGMGQKERLINQDSVLSSIDLEFCLLRLQSSGLLRELTGTFTDYAGGIFIITEGLRKLMEYLERGYPKKSEE